jgi:hypothetical protein
VEMSVEPQRALSEHPEAIAGKIGSVSGRSSGDQVFV